MQESKLIILLKSLSSEEFRWFYKFIRSPYYNANKHLVSLYELLRKFYPDFEHPKLTYQSIFSNLFPSEDFDVQRLRLLFHRLANLVESFIVAEHIKTDAFLNKKLLTRSLVRMNTYDLFQKKTRELLDELEASSFRDEHYFQNKEQVNLQFYAHPATNRQEKGTEYLTNAMESLDTYFVLSKVKLACAMGSRTQTLAEQSNIKYLDIALEHKEWSNILISIYTKILQLQDAEQDMTVFQNVRTLYISNLEKIGPEDKRTILQLLLNFTTRLINKGESRFINYSLELYKIGLEHDCLIINNELSEMTFNNIVSLGTVSREFKWTKSFIEKYGNHLDDKVRTDAITYSRAILYFKQNEYERTIHLLLNHSFSKPLQIINAKTILIRTYVELFLINDSYYDLSIAQINTFEKYIRNNKVLSEQAVEGYLGFVRFTKKMLNLNLQNKDLVKFKAKVESSKNLILKNWLLEKL